MKLEQNDLAYGAYNYLQCNICLESIAHCLKSVEELLAVWVSRRRICGVFCCCCCCALSLGWPIHQSGSMGCELNGETLWMPQTNTQDQKLTMKLLYNVTYWRNRNGKCHEEKFFRFAAAVAAAAIDELHRHVVFGNLSCWSNTISSSSTRHFTNLFSAHVNVSNGMSQI